MIGRALLLLAAAALVAGCRSPAATLPEAPRYAARPAQQMAVTNAMAERIAAEEQAARGGGRAQAIAALKDAQQLAEGRDGYLRAVAAAPSPEVTALAAQENDERRRHYQALAEDQALPLELVEAIAGDARISGERRGRLVLNAAGQPVRKE